MEKQEASAKAQQTRRILAQQLGQLLEKQSFKKITVNDICQGALISRSAFYLHFEDKYHLLCFCIQGELDRWNQALQDSDLHTFLVVALNEILKKRKFYYNLLVAEHDREAVVIFHTLFTQFFAQRLEELGKELPGPVSIVGSFYAAGIVCSMIQWMEDGFPLSVEEMATCQEKLLHGLVEEKKTNP